MRSSNVSFRLPSSQSSAERRLNPITLRVSLLNPSVKGIEEGKVLLTTMADDQSGVPSLLSETARRKAAFADATFKKAILTS